jgi:MSHA pilin protein MshD
MNTGQMLMTMGAMILLSTIVLRVNTSNLTNESIRDQAQYGVLATSIATSIIEEAQSKAFDEKTDTNSVSLLTQLSTVLGPEGGETESTFDDFDDYNGFTKRDSTMPSAIFDISCEVVYVASNDIEGVSTNRTWHKKINVTISSPFTPADTFRTSSIFSYWYFR